MSDRSLASERIWRVQTPMWATQLMAHTPVVFRATQRRPHLSSECVGSSVQHGSQTHEGRQQRNRAEKFPGPWSQHTGVGEAYTSHGIQRQTDRQTYRGTHNDTPYLEMENCRSEECLSAPGFLLLSLQSED